ncbi:hypothetical protein [Bifidobacterium platyrrhinorum]|uniref:Uncharacterized protein n=1 Tax=Bifidobacterium platyrrhinorum TaxID=2661628 RepID=A0A6L9SS95_9BIFI|nr:hypothetical protein [Bifidobacterium platyrrhinorum]NEG55467.1 hypothetical protein [Bifidobacterium platyrrhinorum]
MGYVKLKSPKRLNTDIAILFGAKATEPIGLKVEAKAKGLADAKAKHSSVADRIDISHHAHGSHTAVVMSVKGRDKSQIASHLEFGYFNRWLEHKYGIKSPLAWMPGLHIMSEAKYV